MDFQPILLDVAEQIESERLVMRVVKPGEGAAHFSAVQETIGDLRRHLGHLPWVKTEPSLSNSETRCSTVYANFLLRENLTYSIYLKSDQSYIGEICLVRIDWSVPRLELGYWCRRTAQGKRYVTEAVQTMSEFAFTKLAAKRLEIRADDDNVSSWKVAENVGFVLEGVLKNWDRNAVTNELRDLRIYAKTA